jgi:hypothetical protein
MASVDGGSRMDGVYTRSYDVSVAATTVVFGILRDGGIGAYIAPHRSRTDCCRILNVELILS